ncbi:unnamed protein product [Psylliodes chrysocephalus]|uniref:Uncharacterized protein n=1 Tax=Psylliodes chrysocephalus TaxID=3402493 RepID=A0A9P0GDK2_9CUCU|nr:unnamed protein product [Psylliodes chrysocephala]
MVSIFNNKSSTKYEIARAGEKLILTLHKAPRSTNQFRFISFKKLVWQSRKVVVLHSLPSTSVSLFIPSGSANSLVAGEVLKLIQCSWKTISNILLPIPTTEPPASSSILQLNSCKKGCE